LLKEYLIGTEYKSLFLLGLGNLAISLQAFYTGISDKNPSLTE
jgi:hypothetical protein